MRQRVIGLKFRNGITAAATLVCLAAFLCACGKSAPTETTAPDFPEPWSQAQVFTMPTEPSEEASGSAQTDKTSDEETALRRIEAAHAVFGLFLESRPQLDKNDSVEVEQGLMAYRVTDEHFDTMAKLHAYVSGYFSDEITQNLFNVGIFTEVEGKLYAVDVGMREPTQGELHVEVTEKTEKEEHYRLTVGTDTKKTYEFVYARQKDGSWVFTKFENY
jgi:hypothetical protein